MTKQQETMKVEVVYKEYLDAFIGAITRLRFVLLATVLGSVLVFVGAWNSWELSWQFSRISHLRTAVDHRLWEQADRSSLPREFQKRIQAAQRYLDSRHISSEAAIKELHGHHQRYMVEHIAAVQVPFLGIEVDVNDLGVFGGFAFTILLTWAAFTIYQVRSILEISALGFRKLRAKNVEDAKIAYHMFAMREILSAPPTTVRREASRLRWLSRSLFLLPLSVHLAVTSYDIYSFKYAWSVSEPHTWIQFITECIWGVLLLFLVFWCIRGLNQTDRIWERAFDNLYANGEPAAATGNTAKSEQSAYDD